MTCWNTNRERTLPGDWSDFALCRGVDPSLFHPDIGADSASCSQAAKEVCAQCPVVEACLDYALTNREDIGVWGGTSPRERKRILKRRAKEQTSAA